MINAVVEGQIAGGLAQASGTVLLEKWDTMRAATRDVTFKKDYCCRRFRMCRILNTFMRPHFEGEGGFGVWAKASRDYRAADAGECDAERWCHWGIPWITAFASEVAGGDGRAATWQNGETVLF